MEVPFPPGARNEKAPARFLSGRTSAMFKACVKGGRVVNAFFCFLATLYADARDGPDVTTERTSQRIRPTIGFQWMAERISIAFEIGGKQLDGDAPWGRYNLTKQSSVDDAAIALRCVLPCARCPVYQLKKR